MKNYKCFFIYLLLTFLGCMTTYAVEEEKAGRSFMDAIPVNFSDGGNAFTDVRDSYSYDYYPYRFPWDGQICYTYGNAVYYRLELEYMSDIVIHNWESPEVNCSTVFLVAPIDPSAEPHDGYSCDSVYDVASFMGGEVPGFDSLNAPPGTSRVLGYLRAERVPRGIYYIIVAGSKYMNGSIPNGMLRTTVATGECPFIPDETDYSSQYNSVHTLIPAVAGDTVSMFSTIGSCHREMQYYDGLGRPVQHLSFRSSTEGRNLVSRQEYDILGRDWKQWLPLPYVGKDDLLSFVPDRNLEHESGVFYEDSCAFAYQVYDGSPLNRVKEYYGAGKSWHADGRSVKNDYRINTDTDCCFNFYVSGTREAPALSFARFYPANNLSIKETLDEGGCYNCSFTDEQGHIILERSIAETDTLDTYYVYDDYDNLCFVLPPAASQYLPSLFQTGETIQNVLKQYAYQYRYDYRNRCIGKKLPGCDWVEMIYDAGDRLVFSQDGRQRKCGEWSFVLSDLSGRSVVTGIYYGMPNVQECALLNVYVTFEPTDLAAIHGYVIHAPEIVHLDSLKVLQANYYDTYDYRNKLSGFVSALDYTADEDYGTFYADKNGAPSHCKGLLTGNMTCTLGDERELYGCYYYDYNRNLVQERRTTLNGEITVSRYSFNFSGQPVRSAENYGGGVELKKDYAYDLAGRLIEEVHISKNDTTRFIYSHDALGRVKSRLRVHGTDSLATENDYNIRNWLTAIRSPHFSQTLYYTDGTGTPCYNGNISSMTWATGSDSQLCGYKFMYDGLNRMTDALYGEGNNLTINSDRFNEHIMEYDKMGNILGLKRSGQTSLDKYGLIDNLSLVYDGNQLKSVTDNAVNSVYGNGFDFKDSANKETEYEYDANGNSIKDLNKKITDIQYNILNLPCRIHFEDGNSISYLYDANGVKLRTTHITGSDTTITDYCGNVIYENGVPEKLLTGYGYVSLNNNEYHYFIRDHQGNNRVVVDEDGKVEEVNDYYPFGGLMASSSDSVQPYKYNGKELDRKGGLDWYDYGARQYDAALGRFITIDPLAESSYFVNPYTYCLNNPFNRVDPSGLASHYNWDSQRYEDERGNEVAWESVQQEYGIGKGSRDSNGDDNSPSKPQADSVVETTPKLDPNTSKDNADAWEKLIKLRGPVLTVSTAPIIPKNSKLAKAIWSKSRRVLQASNNTSIASLIFRKYLGNTSTVKWLPKAASLGGQLGRAAGKILMPLGVAFTIYDGYSIIKDFITSPSDSFFENARNNVTTIGMYNE